VTEDLGIWFEAVCGWRDGGSDTELSMAKERYERHYKLKRLGYDLDRIAKRVAGVLRVQNSIRRRQ
jgi:hypothetical protein